MTGVWRAKFIFILVFDLVSNTYCTVIKICGCVPVAKKYTQHTSVLFTGTVKSPISTWADLYQIYIFYALHNKFEESLLIILNKIVHSFHF